MMLIGMLAAGLVVGLYLGLLLALVVFAIVATFRFRGRLVLATWGLVAWLISAPILWQFLYTPWTSRFDLQGGHPLSFEKPRLVEGLGLSLLIAYLFTSPVFVVPLVQALRSLPKPLGPRIQPA